MQYLIYLNFKRKKLDSKRINYKVLLKKKSTNYKVLLCKNLFLEKLNYGMVFLSFYRSKTQNVQITKFYKKEKYKLQSFTVQKSVS